MNFLAGKLSATTDITGRSHRVSRKKSYLLQPTSLRLSNVHSKPVPSGAAHIMPTSAGRSGIKYPWRTDWNFFPSAEHSVSRESLLRTALHQTGPSADKSFM